MKQTLIVLLSALALAPAAPLLRGNVYLSNFDEPQATTRQVRSNQWVATRFTTNSAGSSFDVASVTLDMDSEVASGGNFFVAVYSNTGSDTPNTQIGANLTGSSAPATDGNYTYTATGITLASNTSYWVVLGVSSGSAIYRAVQNNTNGTTGGWTIPAADALYRSGNSGSTWTELAMAELPLRYSITATAAVPEPAHWAALAGTGALGLILLRRRGRAGRFGAVAE